LYFLQVVFFANLIMEMVVESIRTRWSVTNESMFRLIKTEKEIVKLNHLLNHEISHVMIKITANMHILFL